MSTGVVFLIPTYLSDSNDKSFIAPTVLEIIHHTEYFLVENIRTARRYISSLNLGLNISDLHFEVLDKNTSENGLTPLMKPVYEGKNIGVISEAGLPGLADPGNIAVKYCHQNQIKVVPLPGASAIQTALIVSGFNGQQFVFHGYAPIQKQERIAFIKSMELQATKTGYTQLFMETPFRNNALLTDLIAACSSTTFLSVSAGLFGPDEFIHTLPIRSWKNMSLDLNKIPAVFSIGTL